MKKHGQIMFGNGTVVAQTSFIDNTPPKKHLLNEPEAAPIHAKYKLPDGRILFVKQSFMGTWRAFYRVLGKTKSGKDRTKITSFRSVEWRDTAAEAQADLDAYAAKHGLKAVED